MEQYTFTTGLTDRRVRGNDFSHLVRGVEGMGGRCGGRGGGGGVLKRQRAGGRET